MTTENKIFNYLLNLGCCKSCSLRYLREKDVGFNNTDEYITKVYIGLLDYDFVNS